MWSPACHLALEALSSGMLCGRWGWLVVLEPKLAFLHESTLSVHSMQWQTCRETKA